MNARRLQALAVDIGALRESSAFRRLLAGQLVSLIGRQITVVAGPAVGGLVIARFGLPVAYAVDVVTFAAAFIAIALLPPQPASGTVRESPIAAIKRGLQYARREPVLLGGFAMDLSAMIFGLP